MQQRGALVTRRSPGAFRCLVCRVYVRGTDAGHCPRCGFVPPSAPIITPAPHHGAARLLVIVIVVALAILLAR